MPNADGQIVFSIVVQSADLQALIERLKAGSIAALEFTSAVRAMANAAPAGSQAQVEALAVLSQYNTILRANTQSLLDQAAATHKAAGAAQDFQVIIQRTAEENAAAAETTVPMVDVGSLGTPIAMGESASSRYESWAQDFLSSHIQDEVTGNWRAMSEAEMVALGGLDQIATEGPATQGAIEEVGNATGRTTNRFLHGFTVALLFRSGLREILAGSQLFMDDTQSMTAMINKLTMAASDSAWVFMGLKPIMTGFVSSSEMAATAAGALGISLNALGGWLTLIPTAALALFAFFGDMKAETQKTQAATDKLTASLKKLAAELNAGSFSDTNVTKFDENYVKFLKSKLADIEKQRDALYEKSARAHAGALATEIGGLGPGLGAMTPSKGLTDAESAQLAALQAQAEAVQATITTVQNELKTPDIDWDKTYAQTEKYKKVRDELLKGTPASIALAGTPIAQSSNLLEGLAKSLADAAKATDQRTIAGREHIKVLEHEEVELKKLDVLSKVNEKSASEKSKKEQDDYWKKMIQQADHLSEAEIKAHHLTRDEYEVQLLSEAGLAKQNGDILLYNQELGKAIDLEKQKAEEQKRAAEEQKKIATEHLKAEMLNASTISDPIARLESEHKVKLAQIASEENAQELKNAKVNSENYKYRQELEKAQQQQKAEYWKAMSEGTFAQRMKYWAHDNKDQGDWTTSLATFTGNELSSGIDRVSQALVNATFHANTLKQTFTDLGRAVIAELEQMIIETLLWEALLAIMNVITGGTSASASLLASTSSQGVGLPPGAGHAASPGMDTANSAMQAATITHHYVMQPSVSVHPIIDNQGLAVQVAIGNQQREKVAMQWR